MKTNINWYSAETDLGETEGAIALIAAYGWAGYGRFNRLRELIGNAPNCRLDLTRKLTLNTIAGKLGMSPDEFQELIGFLTDPDECGLLIDEGGVIFRNEILDDLRRVMKSRTDEKNRRDSTKQKRGTTNDTNDTTEPPDDEPVKGSDLPPDPAPNPGHAPTEGKRGTTNGGRDPTKPTHDKTGQDTTEHNTTDKTDLRRVCRSVGIDVNGHEAEYAVALEAADVGPQFVAWLAQYARGSPSIAKKTRFVESFLNGRMALKVRAEMIEKYRASKPAKRISSVCPDSGCHGVLRIADGRARCLSCDRWYVLVDGEWIREGALAST